MDLVLYAYSATRLSIIAYYESLLDSVVHLSLDLEEDEKDRYQDN